MSRCTVLVDSRETSLKESGAIIQPGADIHCQIAEVMAGKAKVDPGYHTPFKIVGLAMEDFDAGQLVCEKATA